MSDITTRQSSTKVCTKCSETKPLTEYHKNRRAFDGLHAWCKVCVVEYSRAYYTANRERKAEWTRAWRESNRERYTEMKREWAKANPEKVAESARAWAKANPEKRAEIAARYRAKYPVREAAHNAVSNAVAAGKMPPARDLPCTVCGEQAHEYHHHRGYSLEHRLDVIPLCHTCHTALHWGES